MKSPETNDAELLYEALHLNASQILLITGQIDTPQEYIDKYKPLIEEVLNGSRKREAEHRFFMKRAEAVVARVRNRLLGGDDDLLNGRR